MKFSWKDGVGLTALVSGLILSGISLNKGSQNTSTVTTVANDTLAKEDTKNVKKKNLIPSLSELNQKVSPKRSPKREMASLPTMKSLRDCYQSQNCDFPSNDPREYSYSVGQAIKKELNQAYKRILRGEETRISYWSQEAINSLSVPDGHVKEAALDILSTQPPSQQAFEKILSDVIEYHDPLLIAQALAELQKYQQPQYQVRIYQTLSNVLNRGSLLVKKEIVYNIVPFLNKQSLPYFQDSLKKMNPSSNVHTVLFKILKDYRTQLTGA